MTEKPPVYDELDFMVPEAHVEEYLKVSSADKGRNKKMLSRWESLIKKNKWNISIDSSNPRTITTSK